MGTEIKTLKDLRFLVDSLADLPDNTPVSFENAFKAYTVLQEPYVPQNGGPILINTHDVGSLFTGQHRVLGKGD